MAASGNNLFDQTYKKYYEKEKKQKQLDFQSYDTSNKISNIIKLL